jgi:hypothetical protein
VLNDGRLRQNFLVLSELCFEFLNPFLSRRGVLFAGSISRLLSGIGPVGCLQIKPAILLIYARTPLLIACKSRRTTSYDSDFFFGFLSQQSPFSPMLDFSLCVLSGVSVS